MVVDMTIDKFYENNTNLKCAYHGYCANKDIKQTNLAER